MTTELSPSSPAVVVVDTGASRPVARDSKPGRIGQIALRVGVPMIVAALLLLLWTVATRRRWLSPLLLPPPGKVWTALKAGLITRRTWWPHIQTTLFEMVLGLGIGVVVGLVIGALFAFVKLSRIAFYPFIMALQSFPKIAIAPLLIVALGYGMGPKIVVAALLAYFPVMTASYAGFTEVDVNELDLLRSMKSNHWQELRYLRLPNAMSYLFPALDVAIVSALLGAVAAEFVGASKGLGYLLVERQTYADTAAIFAILILLATLGILLRAIMIGLRHVLPRSIVPR